MADHAILGLHHMTAICGEAQENIDFYTGALGLRLVKRTVNFDDPAAYHLYYGDGAATPGSLVTFFPYPHGQAGRPGVGQVVLTTFGVPREALAYWRERLAEYRIGPVRDGGFEFEAPDGLRLRIAGDDAGIGGTPYLDSPVPPERAIVRIREVMLEETERGPTERLLGDVLGLSKIDEREDLDVFAAGRERVAIRYRPNSPTSRGGHGSVHHIAFRVGSDEAQRAWRDELQGRGFLTTPIVDRNYFRSVYFREPGGALIEIATVDPGFTIDEPIEALGSALRLPPKYEPYRRRIERELPALALRRPAA